MIGGERCESGDRVKAKKLHYLCKIAGSGVVQGAPPWKCPVSWSARHLPSFRPKPESYSLPNCVRPKEKLSCVFCRRRSPALIRPYPSHIQSPIPHVPCCVFVKVTVNLPSVFGDRSLYICTSDIDARNRIKRVWSVLPLKINIERKSIP